MGHTLAFEIPAGTEIVWVTREEMVQVLITQDLRASTQARLDEQLRRSALARGMDEALVEKGGRRRRRRRWCSGAGSMIGGAAAIGGAVALSVFTFIGCTVAAPFLTFVGTTATVNGACDCWNNKGTKSDTACELNGGRRRQLAGRLAAASHGLAGREVATAGSRHQVRRACYVSICASLSI